jgi:hypothetical protein
MRIGKGIPRAGIEREIVYRSSYPRHGSASEWKHLVGVRVCGCVREWIEILGVIVETPSDDNQQITCR